MLSPSLLVVRTSIDAHCTKIRSGQIEQMRRDDGMAASAARPTFGPGEHFEANCTTIGGGRPNHAARTGSPDVRRNLANGLLPTPT
ncbi:MAG TPA: hypothetical protein VNE00_02270 [Paraburkholderia sp.]|jgi:hypothetical protein|nr:hypothetical protein [Paraburkholderia sp.]